MNFLLCLVVLVTLVCAQRFKIEGGETVNLATYEVKASREAEVVFVGTNDVYKMFSNQAAADAAAKRSSDVDVPTPKVKVKKGQLENYENKPALNNKDLWALVQNRAPGTFFQMSKSGHVKILTNAIVAASETTQTRALRSLKAAYEAKVTDPQGFFDFPESNTTPIQFIDVHTGAAGDGNLNTVIANVEKHMAEQKAKRATHNEEVSTSMIIITNEAKTRFFAGCGIVAAAYLFYLFKRNKESDYVPLAENEV